MKPEIKMVAVDVDGTFVRSDYTTSPWSSRNCLRI